MKYTMLLLVGLCLTFATSGQTKNFDIIIVIDGEIAIGTIAKPQIKIQSKEGDIIIDVGYYPGNLSLKNEDYYKIIEEGNVAYLLFTNYLYRNGKQTNYNYEIEIKKSWLKDSYNIIKVYNLDKKPYKGVYKPLSKDKNYTFEISSPSGTFLRARER